jgi:hypothetical protein
MSHPMASFYYLFVTMAIIICVSVPLGIWKLIEIIIWFYKHFCS